MWLFRSIALLAALAASARASDPIFSLACSAEYLCPRLAADGQGRLFFAGTSWDGVPGSPSRAYVGRLDGSALAFFKELGGGEFSGIRPDRR